MIFYLGGCDGAFTWAKYSWFAGNPLMTSDTVFMAYVSGKNINKLLILKTTNTTTTDKIHGILSAMDWCQSNKIFVIVFWIKCSN